MTEKLKLGETQMALTIKADTTGGYGQYGILPALYNVKESFTRAGEEASERHGFAFKPKSVSINGDRPDNFRPADHIQSVARLSGVGQENVLVFTRSARDKGDAALYVVPLALPDPG
ncbi:MAG: hypothetical protein Fur0046_30640 [Cyanobacteria bacterium J069]